MWLQSFEVKGRFYSNIGMAGKWSGRKQSALSSQHSAVRQLWEGRLQPVRTVRHPQKEWNRERSDGESLWSRTAVEEWRSSGE